MPTLRSCIPITVTNPPFDFRSSHFEESARQLAQQTGAPLEACREQLFITEGDLLLARQVIEQGYDVLVSDSGMH